MYNQIMIKKTTNRIKTTKLEIVEAWRHEIENGSVNVTLKNASTTCWRCGVKKRLDRCHIVPHSKGGEDTPSNFVLLCKHCHFDNPNLDRADIIWDWLRAYKLDEEQSFWFMQGEREFSFIYNTALDQELLKIGFSDREAFNTLFQEEMKEAGHHFGQPRRNRATVAGIIAITLDKLKGE